MSCHMLLQQHHQGEQTDGRYELFVSQGEHGAYTNLWPCPFLCRRCPHCETQGRVSWTSFFINRDMGQSATKALFAD